MGDVGDREIGRAESKGRRDGGVSVCEDWAAYGGLLLDD